jgi:pSer/pThr/pTyr-binding forkhead associated (FHA) protein/chromosome segregation ATPase
MSQHLTDLFKTSCRATAPLEINVSGPGWDGGGRRLFEQPFVLVGRHERASLRLEDAAVSRRHAYLQQLGGRIFCVDLGSRTGIRWAGESRPAGWLRPDQGIQIGPFTLEHAIAASAGGVLDDAIAAEGDPLQDRANDSSQLPRITVERDGTVQAQMHMNRVLVLAGNSPSCRLRLREAGISKYHCSLVSTPEGVWVIDLLSETGTYLDGQPVRSALVEEGGQLQVGPYLLRVRYPKKCTATPPYEPSEIRAETLAPTLAVPQAEQSAAEVSGLVTALQAELDQAHARLRDAETLRQQLADIQAKHDQLCARVLELEDRANTADHLQGRLQAADTETEQLRTQLRVAESRVAEWETMQAECVRFRDESRALGRQVAETADLQTRLDAAQARAHELEAVRAERDQWQTEAQNLQTRLASEIAERQEGQQQLESTQRQLGEAREALQRLQEAQDQLDRSQNEVRGLQTELEQVRERLRDAEVLEQQLADSQAECVRLRDQSRELESRVAEAAGLPARLDAAQASTRELEAICAERDRWQTEAQSLQNKLASEVAERQDWQERFEAAQRQLGEEREAVRTAGVRLDQESAALLQARADFAARNDEHSVAVQRLQEAQDQLDHAQNEARGLQAELELVRERLRDAETLRQQLADMQAKHDQLCARVPELEDRANSADQFRDRLREADTETQQLRMQLQAAESRVAEWEAMQAECVRLRDESRALGRQVAETADLQARLDAAQARVRELEAVCAERDQWQAQAQDLQTRLASNPAEQGWARVTELEQALAEAATTHESAVAEARGCWESERQALEARLEQQRQAQDETTQAAVREVQTRAEALIREVQARAAATREDWRKRLEGAEAQIVWERNLFQEQGEQIRRQIANLQTERDRLTARLSQAESLLKAAEERSRNEPGQSAEPEHVRQLAIRDQVFAEFGTQMRHLLGQVGRTQHPDKPPGG